MGNNGAMVAFFFVILLIMVGGYSFFLSQVNSSPKKAITCKNEWSSISFLIEEKGRNKILIMNGEKVPDESIRIFNETAIAAQWSGVNSGTKIFLDRIAARLEVETSNDLKSWEKVEFTCTYTPIRF